MPEYLAPGVYVEETSFRAKSIEGVGTSTTAFVGPCRKGPVVPGTRLRAQLPELITSFADFVRLYGGLEPLSFASNRPNYLAQSVFNYFNEGGVRLYVMRVANDDARGANSVLKGNPNVQSVDATRVAIRSRFRGSGTNGRVVFREILSSGTAGAFRDAPDGSLARGHGAQPTEPARIVGTLKPPFNVPPGAQLRVKTTDNDIANNPVVNDVVITFLGEHAEAAAPTALAPIDLQAAPAADRTLSVQFDSDPIQTIVVPQKNYTREEQLAVEVNALLQGGYAVIKAGKLVIGTDRLGFDHKVTVNPSNTFGFTGAADETSPNNQGPTNNVGKLEAVTVAEIQTLLNANKVIATTNADGRLELSTPKKGENQQLEVIDAPTANAPSAHLALGLPLRGPGEPIATGSNIHLFHKDGADWKSEAGAVQALPNDPAEVVPGLSFLSLTVLVEEGNGEQQVYDEVSFAKSSTQHLSNVLSENPTSRAQQLSQMYWMEIDPTLDSTALHGLLFPSGNRTGHADEGFTSSHQVTGGNDGTEPVAGVPTDGGTYAAAFEQLRAVEDVSIVAAPGHSSFATANYQAIQGLLISHAAQNRAYRIAVLDTPRGQTISEARAERSRIDSHRAALYYPWVVVANPLARPSRPEIETEITLPPSGFVCGIYARNDVEQGVAKAPANEVVRGALRFESDINFAQQQVLNPLGVNCLRFFSGRGLRVWGARTASSDPEWKYVNVRRFFLYLEASIDRGTQWVVFENNGPRLWANVRETVEAFLYNEWVSGNLLGANQKEAYFVRCDRSTMTQNDLDNGRLICLVGVAALKPAEFVIFRIGQKTADTRS
jgi:hypothetical protein